MPFYFACFYSLFVLCLLLTYFLHSLTQASDAGLLDLPLGSHGQISDPWGAPVAAAADPWSSNQPPPPRNDDGGAWGGPPLNDSLDLGGTYIFFK